MRDEQADDAEPGDHHVIAEPHARVPDHVDRRLEVGEQHEARARRALGERANGFDRRDDPILVRVEQEHALADPTRVDSRADGLDPADEGVAIAHRELEAPAHLRERHDRSRLGGTAPERTRRSVPALIPEQIASTRASPAPSGGSGSSRTAATPGDSEPDGARGAHAEGSGERRGASSISTSSPSEKTRTGEKRSA